MAQAYTAPDWTSGEGISASNLQSISNTLEGIVQGSDRAIHNIDINGSNLAVTYVDGTIENFAISGLKGISNVSKSSSGSVDTYTITYTDGSAYSFSVRNGSGSTAEEIAYDNSTSGIAADNVQSAIDSVFTSVSNGKSLVASAITDKGVETLATDSFQTMADNIRDIPTSGGGTDVSDTTATPGDVLLGKIFHLANGDRAEGTLVAPKVASGVISIANYETKDLDLGFKPKYFCIGKNLSDAGRLVYSIYNQDISTTNYVRYTDSAVSSAVIGVTDGSIYTIVIMAMNDNGVTLYSNHRRDADFYYFAIG